jgi:hypothetical protein
LHRQAINTCYTEREKRLTGRKVAFVKNIEHQ